MLRTDTILEKLRSNLSEKRFIHSLGVMDTAGKLAERFGADIKKSKLAGLVHDCAKDIPPREQLKMAENFGILLDDIERREIALIHGPLGAFIAQKHFEIQDEDILKAIKNHTTGNVNMTILDKVIFLADYIEPSRNFLGVDILRQKAYKDIDDATIYAINSTIYHVLDKGSLLHPKTVNARNTILIQNGREERA